jgi:hypothetical protein
MMIEMFRELLRKKSYIPFVFISISLKCMLSEHSSERLRFLIRKGGTDSFESVKKRFLSEGESMMFEQYYHDCENM